MERVITGFHEDEMGDYVAELSCGHNQHVRHRPPFQLRAWVLNDATRQDRVGAALECPLCDRAELPDAVVPASALERFEDQTMPAGLRHQHRLGAGTWGRLVVDEGELELSTHGSVTFTTRLGPGACQAIPPELDHDIAPVGAVRFSLELLRVERAPAIASVDLEGADEGGDAACWVHLICPECGAFGEGVHVSGCGLA